MHRLLERRTTTAEESSPFQSDESARHELVAGVALLAVGIDFSTLSDEEHAEIDMKKLVEMASYENFHRYLKTSLFIREILGGLRSDWQTVRAVKSCRLRGPLGSLVHYLTNMNSDNEQRMHEKSLANHDTQITGSLPASPHVTE
jgi:hypothetical protein